MSAPEAPRFYPFRLITPLSFLLYSLAAALILALPPNAHILKALFAAWLLATSVWRFVNTVMPKRFAAGIWLEKRGFIIQRGPLGRCQDFHSYAGFLRLFALPSKNRLSIAFSEQHHHRQAITALADYVQHATIEKALLWVDIPMPTQRDFMPHLLEKVESDRSYQNTQAQLPTIDLDQHHAAHLHQQVYAPITRRIISSAERQLRHCLWLIGINPPIRENKDDHVFSAPQESTRGAQILAGSSLFLGILAAIFFGITDSEQSLVSSAILLGIIFASGPALWLCLYTFKQHSRVVISSEGVQIYQVLRYFNRRIPFSEIAVVDRVNIESIGLIWLKPRKSAPGDDEHPARPRLILSNAIEKAADCCDAIKDKLSPDRTMEWSPQQLIQRKRHRAILRRVLVFLISPPLLFLSIILIYRIAFAIARL